MACCTWKATGRYSCAPVDGDEYDDGRSAVGVGHLDADDADALEPHERLGLQLSGLDGSRAASMSTTAISYTRLCDLAPHQAFHIAGLVFREWERDFTSGTHLVDGVHTVVCSAADVLRVFSSSHTHQMYAVMRDGEAVGVFALTPSTFGPMFVNHVLVFPEHRGKGNAYLVMRSAEGAAAALHHSVLRLWCDRALVDMYTSKMGWVRLDQVPTDADGGGVMYVLGKSVRARRPGAPPATPLTPGPGPPGRLGWRPPGASS